MLPFLPTALLFRNKFDVRKYAEATDAFVLAIVGDKDRVITPWRSMLQTANFRNSPSVWTVFIDGGDHYSIYEATETWTAVNNFLSFLLEHSYDSSAEPPIFMML
jgi:pimeloyl-ACP methyl ester carboxylesterase